MSEERVVRSSEVEASLGAVEQDRTDVWSFRVASKS